MNKRQIRLKLFTSLFSQFLLVASILMLVLDSLYTLVFIAVIISLIFAGLMTLFLGNMHITGIKEIENKPEKELDFSVTASKVLKAKTEYDYLYKEVLKILESKYEFDIEYEDKQNGIIALKKGRTANSWGEKITVEFYRDVMDKECLKLKIISLPKYTLTVVDYGENLKNVNIIYKEIKSIL